MNWIVWWELVSIYKIQIHFLLKTLESAKVTFVFCLVYHKFNLFTDLFQIIKIMFLESNLFQLFPLVNLIWILYMFTVLPSTRDSLLNNYNFCNIVVMLRTKVKKVLLVTNVFVKYNIKNLKCFMHLYYMLRYRLNII